MGTCGGEGAAAATGEAAAATARATPEANPAATPGATSPMMATRLTSDGRVERIDAVCRSRPREARMPFDHRGTLARTSPHPPTEGAPDMADARGSALIARLDASEARLRALAAAPLPGG